MKTPLKRKQTRDLKHALTAYIIAAQLSGLLYLLFEAQNPVKCPCCPNDLAYYLWNAALMPIIFPIYFFDSLEGLAFTGIFDVSAEATVVIMFFVCLMSMMWLLPKAKLPTFRLRTC